MRYPTVVLALLGSVSVQAQTRWQRLSPGSSPPARYAASMAYDPVRERTLLVGGIGAGSQAFADAWEWDGATWTQVPYPFPPAGLHPALAHDPAGGGIIGLLLTGNSIDTMRWDGASWTQVAPMIQSPPYRPYAAMSAAGNSVVLFGGGTDTRPLNDTWVWNGTSWRQVTTAVNPSERVAPQLAYDSARGRLVMSGGFAGPNAFRDTWEWNGREWTVLNLGEVPAGWKMVFDSRRDRIVKLGFDRGQPVGGDWGTYEITPVGWVERGAAPQIGARLEFSMAYDQARAQSVVFGGLAGRVGPYDETWVYETGAPATFRTFGTGCAGSRGVPSLMAPGESNRPWVGERFTITIDHHQGIAAMLVGGSATSWLGLPLPIDLGAIGMTGCSLLVRPDLSTPGTGSSWYLDLPADPRLVGIRFFHQALVFAPGANPLGVVVSNAGDSVVGAK